MLSSFFDIWHFDAFLDEFGQVFSHHLPGIVFIQFHVYFVGHIVNVLYFISIFLKISSKSLENSNNLCTFAAPVPPKPLNDAQMWRSFYFYTWILAELLPLGVIVNIFYNLKNPQVKKRIALRFGLQLRVFSSWMTIVTLTRNTCCHHARVWNKQNTMAPMIPRRTTYPWVTIAANPLRIYYNLCIIKYLLNVISPNNDMSQKLKSLLESFPLVDVAAMGFPEGWEEEPLWC